MHQQRHRNIAVCHSSCLFLQSKCRLDQFRAIQDCVWGIISCIFLEP
jgi:hypothetical protein